MAIPAESSAQEAGTRKQSKGAPIKFLVPLIYAPVLPLIRLTLRKSPVLRDRVFTAVLAGAFVHGFYLVYVAERIFTTPRASERTVLCDFARVMSELDASVEKHFSLRS